MLERLDGAGYRGLMEYGIRNLSVFCDEVNELNVFPVPDGDTGTNMILTLKNGRNAISGSENELSVLAQKFSSAVVLSARGNSGVIISQFFKGFSESFSGKSEADCSSFVAALENGVFSAYKSVAHPVEGTVLTVLREATEHCRIALDASKIKDIETLLEEFIIRAKVSLENTPELLPVLKNAGVVDSGGAGIVYFFDGMRKFAAGEEIQEKPSEENQAEEEQTDYTKFNKDTRFEYGYCTELLIQTTNEAEEASQNAFRSGLCEIAESVVVSFEDDKTKVHGHTQKPEEILAYCHRFGEFLSLKIENMTVQHSNTNKNSVEVSANRHTAEFAVVAVANDDKMKQIFMDMGVDVVVKGGSGYNPSSSDFIDAFDAAGSGKIVVFPNNSNIILAAEQAKDLYDKAEVVVIGSKSVAECYSALAIIDYEESDIDAVKETAEEAISNVYTVIVTNAVRNVRFGEKDITTDDVVAMSGSRLIAVGKNTLDAAKEAIFRIMSDEEKDVINLFAGKRFSEEMIQETVDYVSAEYHYTEVCITRTDDEVYDLIISFE